MSRIIVAVVGAVLVFGLLAPCLGQGVAKSPTSAPDAAAQAKARKAVLDIYKDDIAQAKKPEEKVALANELYKVARETRNDPASQFALFTLAKDFFADGRDSDTALAVIDETAKSFQVDDLALKLEVLARILADARKAGDAVAVTEINDHTSNARR